MGVLSASRQNLDIRNVQGTKDSGRGSHKKDLPSLLLSFEVVEPACLGLCLVYLGSSGTGPWKAQQHWAALAACCPLSYLVPTSAADLSVLELEKARLIPSTPSWILHGQGSQWVLHSISTFHHSAGGRVSLPSTGCSLGSAELFIFSNSHFVLNRPHKVIIISISLLHMRKRRLRKIKWFFWRHSAGNLQ